VTATTYSQAGPARLDVRDRARVRALVDTLRPAAVVHTAYVQQGPGAWDVTATASGVVAEEAAAVGGRLVHLSTDVVFDGRANRPYREDDPVIYGGPGRSPGKHERAATAALVARHPVRGKPAPPGRPLDCRLDSSAARGLLSTRLRGVHEVLAASR
jgi:dTDP-4-dehydrorhamnose reductase